MKFIGLEMDAATMARFATRENPVKLVWCDVLGHSDPCEVMDYDWLVETEAEVRPQVGG